MGSIRNGVFVLGGEWNEEILAELDKWMADWIRELSGLDLAFPSSWLHCLWLLALATFGEGKTFKQAFFFFSCKNTNIVMRGAWLFAIALFATAGLLIAIAAITIWNWEMVMARGSFLDVFYGVFLSRRSKRFNCIQSIFNPFCPRNGQMR